MTLDWFEETLLNYPRIAIAGGPRCGKTTLSNRVLDRKVYHTDDYKEIGWSEASRYVCALINEHQGPMVVEGVAVPCALRKGMLVDAVIWLDTPLTSINRHHRAMRDGCETVMTEVRQTMTAKWFFVPVGQLKKAIRSDGP